MNSINQASSATTDKDQRARIIRLLGGKIREVRGLCKELTVGIKRFASQQKSKGWEGQLRSHVILCLSLFLKEQN